MRLRPDGSVVLVCPYSKGWLARRPRTTTSPEMPGTAVYWDEEYWEVVSVEQGVGGRVSYHLAPMGDSQTIRSVDGYSAGRETARLEAHRKELAREKRSALGSLFAFVLGLLPADVQRELESEIGVNAERMTMLSTLPWLLFGIFCATKVQIPGLPPPEHPLPEGVPGIGLLLFTEAVIRLRVAMTGRPIGEMFVSVPYLVFVAPFRRRRVDPASRPQPPPPATDLVVRDAYRVREPFLALLSPAEQRELQRIFSFDFLEWGRRTAVVILAVAAIGIVVGIRKLFHPPPDVGDVVSLLFAFAVAFEQVTRLKTVRGGKPAGSFLAFVVRPFTRLLFDPKLYETKQPPGIPPDETIDDQR